MRSFSALALLVFAEISATSPLQQPKVSSYSSLDISNLHVSTPSQTSAPSQTTASNVLNRPALPLLGNPLGIQEPSKTTTEVPIWTNVFDYSSAQSIRQTAYSASTFAPDCRTIYAPYANSTRTQPTGTAAYGRNGVIASASDSVITAAPVSTVICKDQYGNAVTNAATTTEFDLVNGKPTSVYTYPNGDTCTLLPHGQAAVVVSYYKEPNNTVTFTGTPEQYTAPYKVPERPTWCNFLLTPTPISFKTGGFIFSIDTAMAAFNVMGSETTSTIYAVDHNPSVIFARSMTKPNYGLKKTSTENDHLPAAAETDDPIFNVAMGAAAATSEPVSAITAASDDQQPADEWDATTTIKPTPHLIEEKPMTTEVSTTWHLSLYTGSKQEDQGTKTNAQDAAKTASTTSFAITAGPNRVIINEKTYEDLGPDKTSTITYDNDVFVVEPSRIIHDGGDTMSRILPGVTGLVANVTTSTVMNGLDVSVDKGTVIIGDYVYTIGPTASTETIMGQEVVIGPTGIELEKASKTLPYSASVPKQTEVVVAGGQIVTAYGNSVVVIRQTTITYTNLATTKTTTVNDNVLYIGKNGVVIDGTSTLGGPNANTRAVEYAIVGGATLTQVGSSQLILLNSTYTVGPSASTNTTITVGGQTITIGAKGAAANSVTLQYPFGPSLTTTIVKTMATPGATTSALVTRTRTDDSASNGSAETSSSQSSNDSSAGSMLLPPPLAKALFGAVFMAGVVLF
ncbi:hypothetical protein BROUX41_005744 [Berkeleyomyces rouxiae]|uniref:uncharacterized protein n=1 Tax=Berkeleyomyces rouxiae TaxID=2035830 RepID=UPI003B7CC7CA